MRYTVLMKKNPGSHKHLNLNNPFISLIRIFPLVLICLSACATSGPSSVQEKFEGSSARQVLEVARKYLKTSKFNKAISYYDFLLENHPDSAQEAAWALYERALCYYKLKRFNYALKGFQSIALKYPEEDGPVRLAQKMIGQIKLDED